MKATRLNSFKVRMENFYAIYSGIFRTDLVCYYFIFHLINGKEKVKCTLVQALRLCTGRMAYRGNRGVALPFHDHGTRRG